MTSIRLLVDEFWREPKFPPARPPAIAMTAHAIDAVSRRHGKREPTAGADPAVASATPVMTDEMRDSYERRRCTRLQ
ncbi:hypothetical protein KDW61_02120 [Burkholderia cenocepacia]|nr:MULTISPECIES: hypothetical protein [Burkholderia]MBR8207451.1 hypothetical protein [Burkholderia cenocepacia]